MMHLLRFSAISLLALVAAVARGAEPAPIRYILHGGMTPEPPTEEYLRFVEQVKPDILFVGAFDQRLYAAAMPSGKTKAQAPDELLTRWKEVADRLHRSGIRLVGHMEVNVVSDRPADLAEKTGWVGYYEKMWDEKLLGKRPTKTAAELLEEPDLDKHEGADATALCGCRVNTKALNACINKPGWRDVQKRMVRVAVEHGVDGFITNRNYFGHCGCEHCRAGFRKWLGDRHSAEQLKLRFDIADLRTFASNCVAGMTRELDSVPAEVVLEKQRFAKHRIKDFFDDVYVRHGRGLRAELFTAQWNHMAYFDELHLDRGHLPPATRTTFAHGAADERWSLPADLWGRDESLIWYCNWGTTQNTILEKEYAGDTVLYGKLIRSLARGKPVVVNKYDFYRPRNMMAEAAALGYATNAIATAWQTDEDRDVTLRYFAFLRKHEAMYRPAESLAEVGLIFPRRALHAGDAAPLEYVEAAGRALIRRHVLFDVLADDLLNSTPLAHYRAVIVSAWEYLDKAEQDVLTRYVKEGGRLLLLPVRGGSRASGCGGSTGQTLAGVVRASLWPNAVVVSDVRTNRDGLMKELDRALGEANPLSGFAAPWTVEVQAYRQVAARRLVLHLVNYNHQEKAAGKSAAAREAPIAAERVAVRLRVPEGFRVRSVRFHSPDDAKEHTVEFTQKDRVIECRTPGFLVYGLCVMEE